MSSSITNIDMQSMITRMRMMASQVSPDKGASFGESKQVSFSDSLQQSLSKVNELQMVAKEKSTAFEIGEDVPITEVMVAKEKASIAFEATLQVRNKVLSAYHEIMQMPV